MVCETSEKLINVWSFKSKKIWIGNRFKWNQVPRRWRRTETPHCASNLVFKKQETDFTWLKPVRYNVQERKPAARIVSSLFLISKWLIQMIPHVLRLIISNTQSRKTKRMQRRRSTQRWYVAAQTKQIYFASSCTLQVFFIVVRLSKTSLCNCGHFAPHVQSLCGDFRAQTTSHSLWFQSHQLSRFVFRLIFMSRWKNLFFANKK